MSFVHSIITVSRLLAMVLLQACRDPSNSAVMLEFKPAAKANLTQAACELTEPAQDASVALPSGGNIEVRYSDQEAIGFNVERATTLVMRDITISNPAGTPSFEVVVFPEETEANRVKLALRERPGCFWLVTLAGTIVQLEFPGERGDGGISGGLFSSLEGALAAYGRNREEVRVEVESDAEGARVREFWAWREKMDLWEVACDLELQKQFRENDPKTFERLSASLRQLDCSAKPRPPADGGGNEVDRD